MRLCSLDFIGNKVAVTFGRDFLGSFIQSDCHLGQSYFLIAVRYNIIIVDSYFYVKAVVTEPKRP